MLKLMGAFVVGLGAGLAVSWSYIRSLKAQIKVCMSYIHDRIRKDMEAGYTNRSVREQQEANGPEKRTRPPDKAAMPSGPKWAKMGEKPQLIVSASGNGELINYVCSACLRVFPLPGDPTPMKLVAEVFRRFAEHREQEHPKALPSASL